MIKETQEIVNGLVAGMNANGDPDQRAATLLLINSVSGRWVGKFKGWPEHLSEDEGCPERWYFHWWKIREDMAVSNAEDEEFQRWYKHSGQYIRNDDDGTEFEAQRPKHTEWPWFGCSGGEGVLLQIALDIAPGGLLGNGIRRLDPNNLAQVATAMTDLFQGDFHRSIVPTKRRGTLGSHERMILVAVEGSGHR